MIVFICGETLSAHSAHLTENAQMDSGSRENVSETSWLTENKLLKLLVLHVTGFLCVIFFSNFTFDFNGLISSRNIITLNNIE